MIHDASSTGEPIYGNCQIHALVGKFVEGYNTAVLTYGQTGSGKTFAFEGDAANQGIISAAVGDIFAHRTSSAVIKCSFIQLYNERISDMLVADFGESRGLRMRWEIEREFIIEDLREKECASA
jgi:flagellar biosynthesis regulator FlaF